MTSERSSSTPAASRTYRKKTLISANIFIDAIPESRIPNYVIKLQHFLFDFTDANPGGFTPSLDEFESLLHGRAAADTLCVALRLARQVKEHDPQSYDGLIEAKWMNLNKVVLCTFLIERTTFVTSEDEQWTTSVGPVSAEGYPLSVPKPDIGIGLRALDRSEAKYKAVSSDFHISSLKQDVLDALSIHSRYRLIASPSASLTEMAYPFLIFEAKSDSSPVSFAANQAAGGAAKALALLNNLCRLCDTDSELPIFAIAAQGALWEVYICFYEKENDAYHLKRMGRVFDISVDSDLFYLQVILCRIKEWIESTYLPKIEGYVGCIYEKYLEYTQQAHHQAVD